MARPLRIVVNAIPAANAVTGIGRYVIELYAAVRELAHREVEVRHFDGHALLEEPPSGPRNLRRYSALGDLYWRLPVALALPIRLAMHRRRERLFRRLSSGFDIYHETAFFPFEPAAGVRVVQTIHDLSLQLHPEWHPAERVAYARRYFEPRLAWVSRTLCVSEFTKGELAAYHPAAAERATVTPLAASSLFHVVSEEERADVRRRHALPESYVLFVGSGDPRKNMRMLEQLASRGRVPSEIVCAGWSGWAPAGKAGTVRSIGYVPDRDLPGLFNGAAAFVFPSLYEGFGLPVLEAMACGCPVVVPRAHAMPEVAGEAGAYYGAPDDLEGLESTLQRLVASVAERTRHANLGLEQARRFDWRETARRTLDSFEKALDAGIPEALAARRRGGTPL